MSETRSGRSYLWIYEDDSFAPLAQISLRKGDTEHDVQAYWYHNDVSGMPRELTGAGGESAWRAEYRAWGNTLRVEHIATRIGELVYQPLRYQGQYFDNETGLHYNRFRYYDPDAGRIISQDPPGLAGGINLYQYAPNPLVFYDPLGLSGKRIGSENHPFSSSRAARSEAMRQAGIPTSQQPVSQSRNSSGREYRYEVPKNGGGTVPATVQEQTMDVSHLDQPHWEADKVKDDPQTGEARVNDMTISQYKKELLYRRAKGKIIYESYKAKIAALFKMELDGLSFIGLEETDNILLGTNRFDNMQIKKKLDVKDLSVYILELKESMGSYHVFLDDDWSYCGAFTVPSLQGLNENFIFGKEVVDDVLFISTDLQKSISLDYYEMNSTYYIDVTTRLAT